MHRLPQARLRIELQLPPLGRLRSPQLNAQTSPRLLAAGLSASTETRRPLPSSLCERRLHIEERRGLSRLFKSRDRAASPPRVFGSLCGARAQRRAGLACRDSAFTSYSPSARIHSRRHDGLSVKLLARAVKG